MASGNKEQEEEVKVLSVGMSPFGWRVMMALREKGVAYEYHEEDLSAKSPLLLASNPVHKKVPVLLHRGRPVCESLIILQYIDDAWPSTNPLLPQDPYARARTRFWADFADKKFYSAGTRIAGSNAIQEDQEAAKQEFVESYLWLEQAYIELANGKPYFGGDSIGLLDIVVASFATWFNVLDLLGLLKLPDHEKCPHLSAWRERIMNYPCVKEVLAPFPPERVVEIYKLRRAPQQG